MPTRIDNLFYELDLNKQDFDRALSGAQQQLRALDKNTGAAAASLDRMDDRMRKADARAASFRRSMAALGGVLAAIGLKRVAEDLFETATAVEETGAKFETVFGSASGQVDQFIDSFGTLAGLSRQQARELTATTGAIAQGFGFSRQESAGFAQEIISLAGDLASFNNLQGGAAEAARILQSALSGERESLKRLGIVIREAEVQQRALANSGKTSAEALTQQEKATASLQLITEKAGVAVGDLARTQDSAANQARRLRAEFQTMKEDIATALLPTFTSLLGLIRDTVDGWRELLGIGNVLDRSLRAQSTAILVRRLGHVNQELLRFRDIAADIMKQRGLSFELVVARGLIPDAARAREALDEFARIQRILSERAEQEARTRSQKQEEIAQESADVLIEIGEAAAFQLIDVAAEIAKAWEESLGDIGFKGRKPLIMVIDAAKDAQQRLQKLREEEERRKDEERRAAEERFRDLQVALSLIRQATDGALELADAFGVVSDEVANVIRQLTAIASGIASIQAGITLGGLTGLGGIISGGLGVLGGIAGLFVPGAPSPEELARIQAVQENTNALRELLLSLDEFAGQLGITGQQFAQTQQALLRLREFEPRLFTAEAGRFYGRYVEGLLESFGFSFRDLQRVADELQIDLFDEAGMVIPFALQQVLQALNEVEEAFVGFPNTLEGELARLRHEFSLFDVDDPIKQLQKFQEALVSTFFGKIDVARIPALEEFLGLDLTTAEGRMRAQEILRELFTQFATGALRYEDLGFATPEQFLDLLEELNQLLEQAEEQTGAVEGQTQDVRRSVQVTEVQANAILARMDTGLYLSRERNSLLESILSVLSGNISGIQPPMLPSSAGTLPGALPATGSITTVTIEEINMEIAVGAGATVEEATLVADEIVDELDRRIGERLLERRRVLGVM